MKNFLRKIHHFIELKMYINEIIFKTCDLFMHLKFSFRERKLGTDKEKMQFYLTKNYHIIEKGLALPAPRAGFGQPKILDLIKKSEQYINLYGNTSLIGSIRQCLQNYLEFNSHENFILPKEFQKQIEKFIHENNITHTGGIRKIKKQNIQEIVSINFEEFVKHRFSIRDYSDTPIDELLIEKSIDIAKFTPSVCNRQGWHAHYYSDRKTINEILKYQNGNAGFTESINKLILITGNLKAFTKFESNQLFIDGGLFSMNLMLALHANGLGSCPLNTCFPFSIEQKVKKIAQIANHERLIMMLAIGNLKDEFNIAISSRNPTNEILIKH